MLDHLEQLVLVLQLLLGLLALDGGGHLAGYEFEQGLVLARVAHISGIALQHQGANGARPGLEGHAHPVQGFRADHRQQRAGNLTARLPGQEQRLSGADHLARKAAPVELHDTRLRIHFIHEIGKSQFVLVLVIERHEEVLGGKQSSDDFMDLFEKFREGRGGLSGLGDEEKRLLRPFSPFVLGDVQTGAGHARGSSLAIHQHFRLVEQGPDLPIRPQDPDRVAVGFQVRHGLDHMIPVLANILGVQARKEILIGGFMGAGLYAIDAAELVGPAQRLRRQVPVPTAQMAQPLGLLQPGFAQAQRVLVPDEIRDVLGDEAEPRKTCLGFLDGCHRHRKRVRVIPHLAAQDEVDRVPGRLGLPVAAQPYRAVLGSHPDLLGRAANNFRSFLSKAPGHGLIDRHTNHLPTRSDLGHAHQHRGAIIEGPQDPLAGLQIGLRPLPFREIPHQHPGSGLSMELNPCGGDFYGSDPPPLAQYPEFLRRHGFALLPEVPCSRFHQGAVLRMDERHHGSADDFRVEFHFEHP